MNLQSLQKRQDFTELTDMISENYPNHTQHTSASEGMAALDPLTSKEEVIQRVVTFLHKENKLNIKELRLALGKNDEACEYIC